MSEGGELIIGMFVGAMIGFVLGFGIGDIEPAYVAEYRRVLVEHGHAEWRAPEPGKAPSEFVLIEPQKKGME